MPNTAIKVESLSKSYRLGQIGTGTFSYDLKVWWAKMRGKPNPLLKIGQEDHGNRDGEEVWALRDVSFTVEQGEVLGIIGRNGAGKSTLLKILSRVTAPTSGVVKVRGRIASLLEVGTGFHPDLTGRENIYLNGAILGMSREEVRHKFDEIAAFAEVEKFIDTPVKRYSSGMYVRLAFAVAAHLEPEILIVDEVLAVGDASFQNKCFGKMGEMGHQGRTVLFVSHNMPLIMRLCPRAILLDRGRIALDGDSRTVINHYINSDRITTAEKVWKDINIAPGDQVAKLKAVRILNDLGQVCEEISIDRPFFVEIEYWNFTNSSLKPTAIFHIINSEGTTLFASNDFNNKEWSSTPRQPGIVKSRCLIPRNYLAEGQLFVLAAIGTYNPNIVHAIDDHAVSFHVVDRTNGEGVRGEYAGADWPGVVRPFLSWDVSFSEELDANSKSN